MIPKKLRIDKDKRELPVVLSMGFFMTVPIRFLVFFYFIDWHWHDELQYCLVLPRPILTIAVFNF